MAQWISACLFALSANIDNFPIGIAYGLRGMRIGAGGNLLIACLTSLGTAAAMLLGGGLARLIPPDTANALGCMLLVLMGLWMLYREAQGGMGAPEQPPADAGTRLGLRESAALAAALMVNNVGFGVGAQNNSMHVRVQPDTSCGRRRCGQAVRRRASGQVCGSMLGGAHCGAGRLRTFYLTRLIPDNLPALSIDFPFLHRL